LTGKAYNEIETSQTFSASLTVTETHIVLGAGLFGDFNPLHVNEEYCKGTSFKTRILHGPLTSALISAPIGNFFAGTAIAYLEHNCQFIKPVKSGDTLTTEWTILEKIDKPKNNGGIAVMSATCRNQDMILVAQANGKILLKNR